MCRLCHMCSLWMIVLCLGGLKCKCSVLRRNIDLYSLGSGQLINFEKSTIFFSLNTPVSVRDYFGNQMHVQEVTDFHFPMLTRLR